jgi:D-amino-acid dehydrogenase
MAGPRVVVVGGGVIGVSCAWNLSSRGADVLLIERDQIASGASFGNAGVVSAGHPPLNRPGRVRTAILQMLDATSPLYIPPRWDPALWRWLADFAARCTHEHVQFCMDVMGPLGMEALGLFDRIVAQEELACGYRRDGYFEVCRTLGGIETAIHEADLMRRHGYAPEIVDAEALRSTEPALSRTVLGGVFHPEAATLDPLAFTMGLAGVARRQGVELREGADIREVVVRGGTARGVILDDGTLVEADAVVLATGPFSLGLARRIGTRLPVQPGKGYHRDLSIGAGGAPALRIACVLAETSVFCTPMDGYIRFAGTMEFSGANRVMRRARLEQLTSAAALYLTRVGEDPPMSEWCGLRPVSSDGLPIVGPLPGLEGAVVATGHGMLGLTLGPVTGRIVADWVLEGGTEELWEALSPRRFAPEPLHPPP